MNRSEVNEIMARAADFIRSFEFHLPPFAHWSPEEFVARRDDARAIIETRMGWDITDFGRGKFNEFGLFLFTLSNGRVGDLAKGRGMLYAEKLLVARKGQQTPMHRHNLKAEDIINRGGGTMCMEIYMSRDDGSLDDKAMIEVPTDGVMRRYKAGEILQAEAGRERHPDAGRLARLLDRGRGSADRRGVNRQRRRHRQRLPRSDRPFRGDRGRPGADASAGRRL